MSDSYWSQVPEGQQAPIGYGVPRGSTRTQDTSFFGSLIGGYAQVPEGQVVPQRYYDASGLVPQGLQYPTNPTTPATSSIDMFLSLYPQIAAGINNPEVGPILRQAAAEGWDSLRLIGAIQATAWWKGSSDYARTWDALIKEDPASAARMAAETAATMQNQARTLGLAMSPGDIQAIALNATKHGWTDAQQIDALLKTVNWATVQAGDLTGKRDQVKAIGAQYLVGVSDATAQSYAESLASGEMTMAAVASAMQRQAKTRFSWMADDIDQGVTPSQYLMPVRDRIAQELEIGADQVNLMDPKWLSMVETRDPKTGEMRSATLHEATMAARRDSSWADTAGAEAMVSQASGFIRDAFGRRST